LRSKYIVLSAILVVALLAAFGLYLLSYDYAPKPISTATNDGSSAQVELTVSDKGLTATLEPQRMEVRGGSCPLYLKVQNRSKEEFTADPEASDYFLELSGAGIERRLLDVGKMPGVAAGHLIRHVPGKAGTATGPFVRLSFDIMEFAGALPPGNYSLRMRVKLVSPRGVTAVLLTNTVNLVLSAGGHDEK
jgi:hypothetical protein